MIPTELRSFLLHGLSGAAAGAGAAALYPKTRTPASILGGAAIGSGIGSLAALGKFLHEKRDEDLKPGWYVTERAMPGVPDGGMLVSHSSNTFVLDENESRQAEKDPKLRKLPHRTVTGRDGKKRTLYTVGLYPDTPAWPLTVVKSFPAQIKVSGFLSEQTAFDRVIRVPMRKEYSPLDALRKGCELKEEYDKKPPIYSAVSGGMTPEPGTPSKTNCHGFTARLLRDLESMHKLPTWRSRAIFGNEYINKDMLKEHPKLEKFRRILNKSYLESSIRTGLAGALAGGAMAGGAGALYGAYEVDPTLDRKEEIVKHIMSSGAGTVMGGTLGGITGAVVGPITLALRKMYARKQLARMGYTEKQSAAKDYIFGGVGGAALGAGAGTLMNAALGRKLMDKRLLLGGMGVGAGVGLLVGHTRSQERDRVDKFEDAKKSCVRLDENGNVVKGSTDGGKTQFPQFKPGLYLSYSGVWGLDAFSFTKPMAGRVPFLDNNGGHARLVEISDNPIDTRYRYQGRDYTVSSRRMKNGQYALTYEMSVRPRDKKEPGASNPLTSMNGYAWVNDDRVRNSDDDEEKTIGKTDKFQGCGAANTMVDLLNGSQQQYARFYPIQLNTSPEDTRASQRAQALTDRSFRNYGFINVYNVLPWHINDGLPQTHCLPWASYLLHGLKKMKLIDPIDFSKVPRRPAMLMGVDFGDDNDREQDFEPFEGK